MNKSKPRQIITRHTYLRKCPAGHGETGLEQTHSSVNCEIPQSKANIKDVSYPVGLLGGQDYVLFAHWIIKLSTATVNIFPCLLFIILLREYW